ncbi:FAD-dependent monooxygenase, partial [Actinocrispum sp. NPDC049592]|uniref:FAD-dependent monooxygenase n=1 Tax=Actinocrispum sp. NPDC049592 TaxID=3154835 RepID=UPI003414DF58
MSAPVVIAGAGPVGLMLAGELRRADIDVVVIERLEQRVPWPRSLFIQNRSMEVLAQRGLDWFADSPRWVNYNFGFLHLGRLRDDTEFVPRYGPQHKFEELLEGRALQMGTDLRRGHEVIGLDQDADGVTVRIRGTDGEYSLRAAYLVGCDGGRSNVRKLAGIDFPGTPSTLSGITAWISLTEDQFPSGVKAEIHENGIFAVAQLEPGLFRATTIEFGTGLPGRDLEVTAEELRETAQRIAGIDLKVGDVHWISRFGNATRVAAEYRKGRVLLAGDAAHIHFASAAQGLNTGIQDAVNLGWKIAADIQGWAPPGLLDTYHTERHPVGERVCMYSQAQVALYHPVEKVGPLRELLSELFQLEDVSRFLLELSTGLGIKYPAECEHPLAGQRMPDAQLAGSTGPATVFETLQPGMGVLLDLTGGAVVLPEGWSDRVLKVSADPVAELDADVVLVRPDGYVMHVGREGDAETCGGLRRPEGERAHEED